MVLLFFSLFMLESVICLDFNNNIMFSLTDPADNNNNNNNLIWTSSCP